MAGRTSPLARCGRRAQDPAEGVPRVQPPPEPGDEQPPRNSSGQPTPTNSAGARFPSSASEPDPGGDHAEDQHTEEQRADDPLGGARARPPSWRHRAALAGRDTGSGDRHPDGRRRPGTRSPRGARSARRDADGPRRGAPPASADRPSAQRSGGRRPVAAGCSLRRAGGLGCCSWEGGAQQTRWSRCSDRALHHRSCDRGGDCCRCPGRGRPHRPA